ncbi:MAG: translation initiation factor IF-2 N-terminal domain-containing protein [Lachnospiraceae bacterium]
MARIRIHELAKKLGKENKEILNYLTEKGIQVKSPMNSLEEEQVAMVEDKFGKKETKPEGKAEAAEERKHLLKEKYYTGISSAEQPYRYRTRHKRITKSNRRTAGTQKQRPEE